MADLKVIIGKIKEAKSRLTKSQLTFMLFSLSITIIQCGYKAYEHKAKISNTKAMQTYLSKESDRFLGNKDAPVELYILGDTTCGHCSGKYQCIEQLKEQDFFKKGKVKIVFKTLPSNIISFRAEQIIACLGKTNEAYYKILGAIFDNQRSILLDAKGDIKQVQDIAASMDNYLLKTEIMTQQEIDKCVTNEGIKNGIMKSTQELIKQFEISAVPVIYINGDKKNLYNCEQIKDALQLKIKEVN